MKYFCGSAKGVLLIEDEHPTEHDLPFQIPSSSIGNLIIEDFLLAYWTFPPGFMT